MSIPSVTQQRYDGFVKFASDSRAMKIAGSIDGSGVVKATDKLDFVGNVGRGSKAVAVNKNIRDIFLDTIVKMCGVSNKDSLPDSVKAVMKFEDYGEKGKPLTARRIRAVSKAVERHLDSIVFPIMSRAHDLQEPADVNLKARVRVAALACIDDADVLDVVEKGILGIVLKDDVAHHTRSSDAGFRTDAEIAAKVAEIAANVSELRRVANGDREILEAGKRCLAGINGRALSLPPGQFRTMVGNVNAGVAALRNSHFEENIALATRDKSPEAMANACCDFEQALENAMGTRANIYESTEGDTDDVVCSRNFLIGLMLQKCGAALPRLTREALQSEAAKTIKGAYQGIITEGTDTHGRPTVRGRKLCELEVAKSHSQRMDFLLAGASCVSPPASTSRRPSDWSRATVEVKNPRAWGGLAPFLKGIADEAQGKMDAKQEKYLSIISDGTGTGYGLVKLAFTRKMNDAYPPSEAMPGYFTDGITSELGKGLATKSGSAIERLKAFVTEKSAFREACARTRITLGGVKISDDIDEARTQIARFLGMTPGLPFEADKLMF